MKRWVDIYLCEQYWTSPGGSKPQSSSCTATNHPSRKLSVRRTRHAGHCWRSRDELISDVLLWTPSHGQAKAGRPARTYIQQLCVDTGCSPEDLPEAMDDREGWRQRVREIRADGVTWWWWWDFILLYMPVFEHFSDLWRNLFRMFISIYIYIYIYIYIKSQDVSIKLLKLVLGS